MEGLLSIWQAALSPPGGLASVDTTDHLPPNPPSYETYDLKPATSLLPVFCPGYSDPFWICNTISFIAALCVIFLYVCGASLQQRFLVWFVRFGMCIALSAMTLTYIFAVEAITPYRGINKPGPIVEALSMGILAWIALIFLSILVLIYCFLSYIVRKIIKIIKWAIKKEKNTSEEAAAGFRTPNTSIV